MMQYSHRKMSLMTSRNRSLDSTRKLTEIHPSSHRPQQKRSVSQMSTSRSTSSGLSTQLALYSRNRNSHQPRRTFSVLSQPEPSSHREVTAKAIEISELVGKRDRALRLKYKVGDAGEPVPDLLEIRESVRKAELSFMRRMDKQLNTTGNAFLLSHLKRELHIRYHDYLKEILDKTRKNRRYLIDTHRQQKTEKFVLMQNQLPKEVVHQQ